MKPVKEAVRFDRGVPTYTRDKPNRFDIEKQRHRLFPGEINTHLRYGSALKTKGVVDPYWVSQPIQLTKWKQGPLPARNDPGVDAETIHFYAVYAFKRPQDLPSEWIDAVKASGFTGSEEMIDDAAGYLADALSRTKFDAVMPVSSSKPMASLLANAIATKLNVPVWRGDWEKLHATKDVSVHKRWDNEVFKLKSEPDKIPDRILVVDDFITSRQTLVEIARKLYNAGAVSVVGAALCGRVQLPSKKSDAAAKPVKAEPCVVCGKTDCPHLAQRKEFESMPTSEKKSYKVFYTRSFGKSDELLSKVCRANSPEEAKEFVSHLSTCKRVQWVEDADGNVCEQQESMKAEVESLAKQLVDQALAECDGKDDGCGYEALQNYMGEWAVYKPSHHGTMHPVTGPMRKQDALALAASMNSGNKTLGFDDGSPLKHGNVRPTEAKVDKGDGSQLNFVTCHKCGARERHQQSSGYYTCNSCGNREKIGTDEQKQRPTEAKVDKDELEAGIEDEAEEHGMTKKAAAQTAKDHLKRNPKYYSKLKKCGL